MDQVQSQSQPIVTTLENLSIGLKMLIEDGQQLKIDTHNLVPQIEGSMSVNLFDYHGETLVYLIVLTEEADRAGYITLLLQAMRNRGYRTHGDVINRNGLSYYLTCMDAKDDAVKAALIQCIQAAYDAAEFFPPISPAIDTVDFKAITLDGKEVGNEVFAAKDYSIVNVWSTVCKLCLLMLPDLLEWKNELPENVQLLHLTAEREGIAHLDRTLLSQEIEKFGLDPDHVLLYDNGFSKVIDIMLSATPMTFVVDPTGNIVGSVILGPDVEPIKMNVCKLLGKK